MTTTRYAALVGAAAIACTVLAGCAGSSTPPAGSPPSTPPATPTAFPEDCPDVTGTGGSFAAIDYVDFVQAFGRQYVAGLSKPPPTATRSQLGRVVLRSKCSFSALNDRTHKSPGKAHDGDTGFLPPGTPIYALHGWSTDCRLAAERDGHLYVYLAYRNDTKVATPRPCALSNRV